MIAKEKIKRAINAAIDSANSQLPRERQLAKDDDTILLSDEARLDSLEQVNFIVALEDAIHQGFDQEVSLTELLGADVEGNPLATIGSLVPYLEEVLSRKRKS